jgi:hypothetical protein
MNKPQSRPSLRSLWHGARKSVTQPAPLKNPVPVRPSPLNGLIDTVGKAKLEKELCRGQLLGAEGSSSSATKPPSLDTIHRSSRPDHHVSPMPLSRMFYSDANTALQAIEERIIESTPMPK